MVEGLTSRQRSLIRVSDRRRGDVSDDFLVRGTLHTDGCSGTWCLPPTGDEELIQPWYIRKRGPDERLVHHRRETMSHITPH